MSFIAFVTIRIVHFKDIFKHMCIEFLSNEIFEDVEFFRCMSPKTLVHDINFNLILQGITEYNCTCTDRNRVGETHRNGKTTLTGIRDPFYAGVICNPKK